MGDLFTLVATRLWANWIVLKWVLNSTHALCRCFLFHCVRKEANPTRISEEAEPRSSQHPPCVLLLGFTFVSKIASSALLPTGVLRDSSLLFVFASDPHHKAQGDLKIKKTKINFRTCVFLISDIKAQIFTVVVNHSMCLMWIWEQVWKRDSRGAIKATHSGAKRQLCSAGCEILLCLRLSTEVE